MRVMKCNVEKMWHYSARLIHNQKMHYATADGIDTYDAALNKIFPLMLMTKTWKG